MLYRRLIEDRIDDSGVVLSDGTRDYTIRQIHEAVNGCRLLFREHRLRKGDRVTVSDSNPALAAFTLLACIAEGCICVPLSDCLDLASRREILENCAPALVVSSIPPPFRPSAVVVRFRRRTPRSISFIHPAPPEPPRASSAVKSRFSFVARRFSPGWSLPATTAFSVRCPSPSTMECTRFFSRSSAELSCFWTVPECSSRFHTSCAARPSRCCPRSRRLEIYC